MSYLSKRITPILMVVLLAILCVVVSQKLERIVVSAEKAVAIAERTEKRLNAIADAAAPLGIEAVATGTEILKSVDGRPIGKETTEGAAKAVAAGWDRLKRMADSDKNKSE